jgi:general secretion pathway protein J
MPGNKSGTGRRCEMVGGIPYKIARIRKPKSGFTLMEILLAIFIFSIIVTTVFGSFRAVFSSTGRIEDGIKTYVMAKNCLNRMILDLQSIQIAMPPAYRKPNFNSDPDPYRIVGDASSAGSLSFARLRFTSLAHVSFGADTRKGIAEIVYYVQETENDAYVLRRSDTLYPYQDFEEKASDPVLCERVKSLTFTYYDAEGTDYELWDSESDEHKHATPKAIGVKLEIGDSSTAVVFETTVSLPVHRDNIG